jgi:hypothetical protein
MTSAQDIWQRPTDRIKRLEYFQEVLTGKQTMAFGLWFSDPRRSAERLAVHICSHFSQRFSECPVTGSSDLLELPIRPSMTYFTDKIENSYKEQLGHAELLQRNVSQSVKHIDRNEMACRRVWRNIL